MERPRSTMQKAARGHNTTASDTKATNLQLLQLVDGVVLAAGGAKQAAHGLRWE